MLALDEGEVPAAQSSLEESLAMYRDVSNRRFMAGSLEGLAGVAAAQGHAIHALRLAGAAASLRVLIGRPHTTVEQVRLDHWLEPARENLGEAARAAAWASGQALSLERAIAEALGA